MFVSRIHSKILVLVATLAVFVEGTDYCDPSLCHDGQAHIGCNHDGNFASSCQNPAMITLTQENKNFIVNAHNTKRDLVAGGHTQLEMACRMATMQWDDELAYLAALNVRRCEITHDACRNTKAFKYSGQNLAMIALSVPPSIEQLLQNCIDMWYDEVRNTEMSHINRFPSSGFRAFGHFTVMMMDRNIRVGCAASSYDWAGMNATLFACNYATTNMIDYPIYQSCSTPASECESGRNSEFRNLCSTSENYDVNEW
ncbi:antigen 5 like allergen Cul n 1-like [Anastrepha obliqua]|uniref:antigen 5 like allergen Cul n 1-like n=1 Tax=Anastrepha obliqua TaxID=95512 RepID=UPI00240A3B8D|nr:antigen 5 like allergen Cul n 1-like [Anastrepha obliqua]